MPAKMDDGRGVQETMMDKLIPEHIALTIPPLDSCSDKKPYEITIPVKLFGGPATWHIFEYDPERMLAFGLCDLGFGCPELGFVDVREISEIVLPLGLRVERDLYWDTSTTLADIYKHSAISDALADPTKG